MELQVRWPTVPATRPVYHASTSAPSSASFSAATSLQPLSTATAGVGAGAGAASASTRAEAVLAGLAGGSLATAAAAARRARRHCWRGRLGPLPRLRRGAEVVDIEPLPVPEVEGPSSTSSLVPTRSSSDEALDRTSSDRGVQRFKGFDRSVLRDRSGEVIGGDGHPEAPGAKEFYKWLKSRGCKGIEDIKLRLGGGVSLREKSSKVPRDQAICYIPRQAWLMPAKGEDPSSPEALAWRLLVEAWRGEKSDFAPFVKRLREVDVTSHPIFWDKEEVSWIKVSTEGWEAVTTIKAEVDDRVDRLLERVRSEAKVVPANLLEDEEALEQELRWACCICEAQGAEIAADDGSQVLLCPLMGDLRTKSSRGEAVGFDPQAEGMEFVAGTAMKPGTELLQKVEASSAWQLANLGIVPGSELLGVPSDEELVDANLESRVMLQVPEIEPSAYPDPVKLQAKLKMLNDYADLDLAGPRRPNLPAEKFTFQLPQEVVGQGRLLPTYRFLLSDREMPMGDEYQKLLNRSFRQYFQTCNLKNGLPPFEQTELEVEMDEKEGGTKGRFVREYTLDVEIDARKNVIRAIGYAVQEYNDAIAQIARATDLPNGSSEGVMEVAVGQIVLAHFKAKRASTGETAKSKKPREARVIRFEADKVRVEFLGNKRRHEVPASWIVGAKPVPSAGLLTSGCTSARLARGKLAITLLRSERAVLSVYSTVLVKTVDDLEDKSRRYGEANQAHDKTEAEKLAASIQGFLDHETLHVDEDMEWRQPQSLSDCPQMEELFIGEVDPSRPLWNMPPGMGSYAPEGMSVLPNGQVLLPGDGEEDEEKADVEKNDDGGKEEQNQQGE